MYSLNCFVYQVIEVKSFEMKGVMPTDYSSSNICVKRHILTSAQIILLESKQSTGSKRCTVFELVKFCSLARRLLAYILYPLNKLLCFVLCTVCKPSRELVEVQVAYLQVSLISQRAWLANMWYIFLLRKLVLRYKLHFRIYMTRASDSLNKSSKVKVIDECGRALSVCLL